MDATPKDVADFLRSAKALIATPATWLQGGMAKTANDKVALTHSQEACKFCSLAALIRAGSLVTGLNRLHQINSPEHQLALSLYISAHSAVLGSLPDGAQGSITVFNDKPSTTHADVMQLFDRAIAKVES